MKRVSDQPLIPIKKIGHNTPAYDIYPSFSLENGTIEVGYEALAEVIWKEETVILDGYIGIDWNEVSVALFTLLKNKRSQPLSY